MGLQSQTVEKELIQLFNGFVDAGLHGRFDEALSLVSEQYSGVGMGEQGIVRSKEEVAHILRDAYIPLDNAVIEYEVKNFTISMLSRDVAVVLGEIIVINTPVGGETMYSGFMQTVGARLEGDAWRIVFTHASPTVLSVRSVEAYPIRFMDNTLSVLRADLQAGAVLQRDPLTGILNREGFERRAEELMRDYNPKHNTALFMIDLDNFKQINDRLGHQTGDAVLKQVSSALKSAFRDVDAVGRIGGDEFMVLMTGDFSVKFLEKKANELLGSIQLSLGDGKEISISISIGIAYGRARSSFDKLYQIADIALYDSKNAGKCSYHMINFDTNAQCSFSGAGSSLLSLQRLLDNTTVTKTPYEALVENIPGGVVMFEFTDEAIRVTHCNEWFSRFIGYSEEQMAKEQAKDRFVFVHPEDLTLLLQVEKSIRDGADSSNIIYRVRHKDGSYSHIAQTVSVIYRQTGSIVMYGIETDVEQTHRLTQEVEDAKNELEQFLHAIPGGVLSIHLTADNVQLTHRNHWIHKFLGYSQQEIEELERGDAFALIHPQDMSLIKKEVEKMHNGVDDINIVYRLLKKDGKYINVRINASLINYSPTEAIYYAVIADVEQMAVIQSELEHAKKNLDALLAAVPGGIAIFEIGQTLKVEQYGSWARTFSGYDSDEELEQARQGDKFAIIFPDDVPKTKEAFRKVREDRSNRLSLSLRIKCKDGAIKPVHINGSVIERTPDKVIMYVIYTEAFAN